jgi:tetratricopeptide (TPR) repeat protein
MIKPLLLICLVAFLGVSGCSSLLAKTSQLAVRSTSTTRPLRGLKVTDVFPDSPAEEAGIKTSDVIVQYGEYQIVDDATFFAARNHYDKPLSQRVELVVWRPPQHRMSAMVRTGKLGVMTTDYDKVSEEFFSLMTRINTMREIPEYMLDREFKGQFNEGPSAVLAKAKALIDQAERDGSLTPTQILVDRIFMILDEAPEEDQKRQAELLKQLFASQPANFIHMLGNDKFYDGKRYRPAVACMNRYLATTPDDVSIRLNTAYAYNQLEMYEQADAAANYVFDHNLGVSEYGAFVGFQAKATAALGRKDYRKSIQLAWKAFDANNDLRPLFTSQLAAAQMGDIGAFEQAVQKLQEYQPNKYLEMKLEIDAADAYAMAKNNQRESARKLVRAWKDLDRAEGKVISFWRGFPDGMDVARNFAELMKN